MNLDVRASQWGICQQRRLHQPKVSTHTDSRGTAMPENTHTNTQLHTTGTRHFGVCRIQALLIESLSAPFYSANDSNKQKG